MAYANLDPGATQALPARLMATRIIWYVSAVISALLALRFALALLGANATSFFAHLIYSVTTPFAWPFFRLFSYTPVTAGVSRFEASTLVAIAVYALVAWGLVTLVTISRPRYE